MGKNVHDCHSRKSAFRHMQQQGFGPFRQRFAPVPKKAKAAPSVTSTGSGKAEKVSESPISASSILKVTEDFNSGLR